MQRVHRCVAGCAPDGWFVARCGAGAGLKLPKYQMCVEVNDSGYGGRQGATGRTILLKVNLMTLRSPEGFCARAQLFLARVVDVPRRSQTASVSLDQCRTDCLR